MFEDIQQNPTEPTANKPNENNSEEVDDIELIFSSDDKDFGQDDLVSISGDYEPWEKAGSSGTPILVNFAAVGSDQETDANSNARMEADTLNQSAELVDQENREPISDSTEIRRDDSYDKFEPVNSILICLIYKKSILNSKMFIRFQIPRLSDAVGPITMYL